MIYVAVIRGLIVTKRHWEKFEIYLIGAKSGK